MIIVVEGRENSKQLNCCCKDHQDMENLMGTSNSIEPARLEGSCQVVLYPVLSNLVLSFCTKEDHPKYQGYRDQTTHYCGTGHGLHFSFSDDSASGGRGVPNQHSGTSITRRQQHID
jgi:hypothetical protein